MPIFYSINKLTKLSVAGSFFLLMLFLFSCGSGNETIDEKTLSNEEKTELVAAEIKNYLGAGFNTIEIDGITLVTSEWLRTFYNPEKPVWYDGNGLNKEGEKILAFLSKAHYYGLDTSMYHTDFIRKNLSEAKAEENFKVKAQKMALNDLLITDGIFLFATHVHAGFLNPDSLEIVWKKDSVKTDFPSEIKNKTADEIITKILAMQPRYFEYQDLIVALKPFLDSNTTLSEEVAEFASPKKDSSLCGKQVRERLVHLKYLKEADKEIDSMARKALIKYQEDHALDNDGKIGKNTLQSLSESEMDKYRRVCLALEKWRWKNRSMDFQFRLNIPAYELTIIRNDSIIHRERAVTGTVETQTPELTAKMKWITLHPYWHLPHSISSTEFLYSAKRDTSYMRKAGYQLFTTKNEPVEAGTVDFKKLSKDYFPYRVRQNGGYGNSLGLIVFHFPNKHDVYMHDTPAKYLFKRSTRAFSHGCMRLNEPFKIGEIVMKNERPKDTITADTLKKWALKGFEQRINLKKQVPVEVDYISVSANTEKKLIFHLDIYRRDERFLPFIYPKKTKVTDNQAKEKTS